MGLCGKPWDRTPLCRGMVQQSHATGTPVPGELVYDKKGDAGIVISGSLSSAGVGFSYCIAHPSYLEH